jgi:hypothetical protein
LLDLAGAYGGDALTAIANTTYSDAEAGNGYLDGAFANGTHADAFAGPGDGDSATAFGENASAFADSGQLQ